MEKNHRRGYKYTKEEIDYITERFGTVSTSSIAKKLGRSVRAIEKKAVQIFGTAKANSVQGLYSSEEISIMLGVWKGAVAVWIKERGLPATAKPKRLKKENKGSIYCTDTYSIDLKVFFDWLKENKNNVKVDFDKVDMESLPYAPDWFKEDYKNKNHYNVRNRVGWSEEDVSKLLYLFYVEGKTLKEIADILGRTYSSVRKKKQYLNERGLVKIPNSLTKIA